jgi:hypothetical protein
MEPVVKISEQSEHVSFCWLRIRIRNMDLDPEGKLNADPCESGSETLLRTIPFTLGTPPILVNKVLLGPQHRDLT